MNKNLRENITLLKEKFANLEKVNSSFNETLNKKKEQIPLEMTTTYEYIKNNITETIKIELQKSLKPFELELNKINHNIDKHEDKSKSSTKKPKNNLSSDKQNSLARVDKIPVTPKQQKLVSVSPRQNNLISLEHKQQSIMNELIHIESDNTSHNGQENTINSNAQCETENSTKKQKIF